MAEAPGTPDLSLLVPRIVAGDAPAEAALITFMAPRVRAMLLARTRNPDLAGDLTQDTLMAVLQAVRRGQMRDPSRLVAFVLGVARNLVNNHVRSQYQHPESPLDEVVASAVAADDRDGRERRRLLARALVTLSAPDREVLLLTLVHGLKSGEIAERLDLPADVVRTRKARALRRVADAVEVLSRPARPDHSK